MRRGANGAWRDDSGATCPRMTPPAKSTKKEETGGHKPDPDTSSWLETFLITNSCLWVTRPANQAHGAAAAFPSSPRRSAFRKRSFSQCPLVEHPGLLCKSNNCFKTGPTHFRPNHLHLIRNVPLFYPPPIYLHTARTHLQVTLQEQNNLHRSSGNQFPFYCYFRRQCVCVCVCVCSHYPCQGSHTQLSRHSLTNTLTSGCCSS